MTGTIARIDHGFGRSSPFTLGAEEELLLVDSATSALAHDSADVLARIDVPDGSAHHEFYAALIELSSPICRDAPGAVEALRRLRGAMRAAGGAAIGAGLHPSGAFGDAPMVPKERYRWVDDSHAGVTHRTPEAALHVHVGMPDPETAIVAFNGLRERLPLLQALAANSPFWYGLDSGHASARAAHNRAYPRFEVPRAFRDYADYATTLEAVIAAGGLPDYTLAWWDVRPHPRLGTVEVRTMDSQSSLDRIAGLAALIHGLAAHAVEHPRRDHTAREALVECCHRATRYGLRATIRHEGSMQPIAKLVRRAAEVARPHARELGSEAPLEEIERILREGNGADRQRAAHARGGMEAVLEQLVRETAST